MTEENKQTPPETKPSTIEVDVYGEKIQLPLEQAKAIIGKRDERHAVFKDLDKKVKDYETKLTETTRQAEAQKLALEGKLAEAEALFSKKSDDKLANIQNRIIHKEVESALLADESFLKESKDDALKLLKADFKFKLDESGEKVITEDGKEASVVVAEWLKNKAIFKRATGVTPTGGKVIPTTKHKQQVSVSLGAAMLKRLNDNKK